MNNQTLRDDIYRALISADDTSLQKIGGALGVCKAKQGKKSYYIPTGRPRGKVPKVVAGDREKEMLALLKNGKSLQEVGDVFNLTGERVRQLVKKYFAHTSKDSVRGLIRAVVRIDAIKDMEIKANKKYFDSYGVSKECLIEINDSIKRGIGTPAYYFSQQKKNALNRGKEFNLTLKEWWDIWQESGKYSLRGIGKGYCMARWGDSGGYEVGNVYICTMAQNSSDSYITKPASDRAAKAKITIERNKNKPT